jgi:hypothetical protein
LITIIIQNDENYDPEADKITDNLEIKEKGFTAVPTPKNGNDEILKVSFSA